MTKAVKVVASFIILPPGDVPESKILDWAIDQWEDAFPDGDWHGTFNAQIVPWQPWGDLPLFRDREHPVNARFVPRPSYCACHRAPEGFCPGDDL